MNFEMLQTSRSDEKFDQNSVILKIEIASILEYEGTDNLWLILRTLIGGGINKIIIDMNDLSYIDSKSIGMLINTAKLIRTKKGDVGIIKIPESIEEILKPINLKRFIKSFISEEEAIRFLKIYV